MAASVASRLRDGGVAFVPLTGEDALVVLTWRADAGSPMLPALRAVVHDVAAALAG